jgi:hypothetical protein
MGVGAGHHAGSWERRGQAPGVLETLMRQNKPGGHMCTSCAWTKPAEPHLFEFCENGAKATIWDLTTGTGAGPEFFAEHTVTELRGLVGPRSREEPAA